MKREEKIAAIDMMRDNVAAGIEAINKIAELPDVFDPDGSVLQAMLAATAHAAMIGSFLIADLD